MNLRGGRELPGGLLPPRAVHLFLALTLAGGCGDSPHGATEELPELGDVRDVHSAPPYPTWSTAPVPLMRLGDAFQGMDEHQLSDVHYAATLSDGGVVVVDGGSAEVRWFAEDGTLTARAGGRGQGPGELSLVMASTLLSGDTILLFDSRNQRLTWFDPEGALVGTRPLPLGPALEVSLHETERGSLLMAVEAASPNLGGSEFNLARDSVFAVLLTDTTPPDTILRLLGKEAVTWVQYSDGRPTATRQMELPFGEVALVVGLSGWVVMAPPGEALLQFLSLKGTPHHSAHRSDTDSQPITGEFRQRYVQHTVEGAVARGFSAEPARAGAESLLALLPEARNVPVHDRILVDPSGERIWLRDFQLPWTENDPQSWTVHDPSGRVLARVTTPAGLEIMHVAHDRVTGVSRDDMGVESVVVYEVRGDG
ncbi:MAG: hypothetical protein WEA09_03760 [Gemmatimonadota bacterium]